MKLILVTSYFFLIMFWSQAQSEWRIKLYQNTDIFQAGYYDRIKDQLTTATLVKFNRFSLAVNFESKNNFTHEIELLIPEIGKSPENIQFPLNYTYRTDFVYTSEATIYSLRYEFGKTFKVSANQAGKFAFNFGVGINPYYLLIENTPIISNAYSRSTTLYGTALNIIPRVTYKFTNRLMIDLNIPLRVYNLRGEKIRVMNPAIPIAQQTTNDYDSILFEKAYTIRLGLSYKLR